MNEVATRPATGSTLAIRTDQMDWTPEQAQALLEMFSLGNAPHAVIRSYFHICQTTGLDPFKRQIHLIERSGKFTPQTSIDGFRIIRDRSRVYDGDETFWCGDDGQWTDAWLKSESPTACKFVLYVKGRTHPVTAVARWSEYVQLKRDGGVTQMWSRMAAHMLAKVAEALAIRKAFPDDTGGLYTDDEMMQAEVLQEDGSTSGGRQRSPGLLDVGLEAPPEPQRQQQQTVGGMGTFLDAGPADPNIVDAEVVPDEQPEPAQQPAAAASAAETAPAAPEQQPQQESASDQRPGEVMNMAPEPRAEIERVWSKRLAEFCESQNPMLHELQALYQEADAAGALGELVPWAGDPRQPGLSFHETVMAVKSNLEQGLAALEGLA